MSERMEDQLKEMVVKRLFMKVDPTDIDENKSLIDEYDVDSVSLLELVVGIEELFGVRIEDQDFRIEHFETITALTSFIKSRQ
jgi:acyl carrier protein